MNASTRFEPHYRAVVAGGGQAGLCASHFLSEAGIGHVVFEKKTIMHNGARSGGTPSASSRRTGNASCQDIPMTDLSRAASW
jgi:glycine/D-amino acid oxidase-like deaminating enzyme